MRPCISWETVFVSQYIGPSVGWLVHRSVGPLDRSVGRSVIQSVGPSVQYISWSETGPYFGWSVRKNGSMLRTHHIDPFSLTHFIVEDWVKFVLPYYFSFRFMAELKLPIEASFFFPQNKTTKFTSKVHFWFVKLFSTTSVYFWEMRRKSVFFPSIIFFNFYINNWLFLSL